MKKCEFYQDCLKLPIKASCVKFCLERVLKNITPEEKKLILGLDEKLADKIFNIYQDFFVNSFDDIEKQLKADETKILMEVFLNINQFQLNYFLLPKSDRDDIINAIKKLDLGSNNSQGLMS